MNDGYLSNECKNDILDVILQNDPITGLEMGLFTAPSSVSQDTVLGNLTEQVGTGYARILVENWAAAALGTDDASFARSGVMAFENTGSVDWAQTLGFFFYNHVASLMVAVGLFDSPITFGPSDIHVFSLLYKYTGDTNP